jgi:peptide/nickel transport system permease protein
LINERRSGSARSLARNVVTVRRLGPRVLIPAGFIAAISLAAVFAPVVAPHNPLQFHLNARLVGPTLTFPLGTDQYGRDTLSRLIYGARATMEISAASTAVACGVGTFLGLLGGYYRSCLELICLRLADVILAFPPIILALLVVTLLGSGIVQLIAVIAFLYLPTFLRLVYGQVLSLREMGFVEASRALGTADSHILRRTILPHCLSPIIVQFSLTMAAAILLESGLSFLGLGVLPPAPSWGQMISDARGFMLQDPLSLLWPCLTIVVTIMALTSLGDALRDRLDPRLRQVYDEVEQEGL